MKILHMTPDEAFIYDVLNNRNGEAIITQSIDAALTFAVLGHISYSVEIINLVAQLGLLSPWKLYAGGLHFAWDAVDHWPDVVPAEHKAAQYLTEADNDQSSLSKWSSHLYGDRGPLRYEDIEFSEVGLSRLLSFIRDHGPEELLVYSNTSRYLTPKMAVVTALDIALRLGGHNDDVDYLFTQVYQSDEIRNSISFYSPERGNSYIGEIGKSRRVWALIKDGRIGRQLNEDQDIDAKFKIVKDALTTRIKNGVAGLPHRSMGELLEKLNANTIYHDVNEYIDIIMYEELQSKTFMGNRSIFHQPATNEEIQDLERTLGVKLPEDYKDLLRHSNGLEGIWNGYYHQSYLGPSHGVKWSEEIWGHLDLTLDLVPWDSLPVRFDTPIFDLTQTININSPDGEEMTWLVKPELTKKAVAAVFDKYEMLNDDEKELTRKVFASHFGSLEAIKDMEWCVVDFRPENHFPVYKSVRDFLEVLVQKSEKSYG